MMQVNYPDYPKLYFFEYYHPAMLQNMLLNAIEIERSETRLFINFHNAFGIDNKNLKQCVLEFIRCILIVKYP